MRLLRRVFVLATLLCASEAFGDSADGEAPNMQNVTTCFSGFFGDYEGWVSTLERTKKQFNKSDFLRSNPKSRYEEFKAQLDCEWFDYSVNDLLIRGFVVRPKRQGKSVYPVIIFNRGGNGDFGAVTPGYLFQRIFPIASDGFIVIGSQYRGVHYKDSPSRAVGSDEFGGKEIDDVLKLLPLIDSMPEADRRRIGIWGWSRGGIMAFLSARLSARFSALAAVASPGDLLQELELRPEMENVYSQLIPNYKDEKVPALLARSPLSIIEHLPLKLPILLLHGQADQKVPASSALSMASKLQALNRPYKLIIYENGTHELTGLDNEVIREISSWFKTKLSGEPEQGLVR